MTPKRCALYRHFDVDDLLLYLGISDDPIQRGKDHARDSDWVRYAVRAEVTWYNSRAEALVAEKAAIIAERPLFNRQHNGGTIAAVRRARYLDQSELAAAGITKILVSIDGQTHWSRKILVEEEGQAAKIIYSRDAYVDHWLGERPDLIQFCRGTTGAGKEFRNCAEAGLEVICRSGIWPDEPYVTTASNRFARLYVPLDLVDEAVESAVNADTSGDLSGVRNLADRLWAMANAEAN